MFSAISRTLIRGGGSYPSAEVQSVYSTPQPTGQSTMVGQLIYIYIYIWGYKCTNIYIRLTHMFAISEVGVKLIHFLAIGEFSGVKTKINIYIIYE